MRDESISARGVPWGNWDGTKGGRILEPETVLENLHVEARAPYQRVSQSLGGGNAIHRGGGGKRWAGEHAHTPAKEGKRSKRKARKTRGVELGDCGNRTDGGKKKKKEKELKNFRIQWVVRWEGLRKKEALRAPRHWVLNCGIRKKKKKKSVQRGTQRRGGGGRASEGRG